MAKLVLTALLPSSGGNPPLRSSASTTVYVNLLDLNDNDPAFLNLPFVAEVPEGPSYWIVCLQDQRSSKRCRCKTLMKRRMEAVTLGLQVGMPRLDFRLNSSTGVLFSTAALDREQIGQYYLRLVAFDAGQYPRTSTSTLTITGGNQDGKFSVGFRNGVVRTVVDLDRETQASYTLVIEAIDNGPAGDRKTGTATVYVAVLDVNDNRPIFLQNSYETTILESAPRGTSVLQTAGPDGMARSFNSNNTVWKTPSNGCPLALLLSWQSSISPECYYAGMSG
ncbi:hypothetical protein SRHO_G00036330 [Serrasalmus rhombeus]